MPLNKKIPTSLEPFGSSDIGSLTKLYVGLDSANTSAVDALPRKIDARKDRKPSANVAPEKVGFTGVFPFAYDAIANDICTEEAMKCVTLAFLTLIIFLQYRHHGNPLC